MISKDEITEARRKKHRKYQMRRAGVLLAVVGCIAAAAILISLLTPTTFRDISDTFKVFFTSASDFPAELSGGTIKEEKQLRNAEMILTKSTITFISDNGTEMFSDSISMSDPWAECGKTRTLLFDRGNKDIRVYNRTSLLRTISTDNPIIDGDMSRDGDAAVLTESSDYTAELKIYTKASYSESMTWYCADGFPYSVEISDDGGLAAVSALEVSDSGEYTKIYIIDTGKKKELLSVDVDGLVQAVEWGQSGSFVVFTQGKVAKFSQKGEKTAEADVYEMSLMGTWNADGTVFAAAYGTNSISDINAIVIFDRNLEKLCTLEDVGQIDDIYLKKNSIYVLGGGTVSAYDVSGTPAGTYAVDNGAEYIEVFQYDIWCIGQNSIVRIGIGEENSNGSDSMDSA
ncbi:MAG: DUF5711 family protein [Oscillospiraceae bacterium]|jgi:hypothetical protein